MWQKVISLTKDRKALFKYVLLPVIIVTALILGGMLLYRSAVDPERAFQSSEEDWCRHFDGKVINIALLGFDRDADRDRYYRLYRPDTIMIASIDLREVSLALVSIPRDSYVKIHGTGGYDKINHTYMYGHDRRGVEDPHRSGIETVLKTIEDFLGGVPVHYYISLDMDGVVEIIDRLGGFYYDVDVECKTNYGRGRTYLEKGYQHLNGNQFLNYVRYRAADGDLSRAERQQRIMVAAFRQLRRQGRLRELPGIYRSLSENVETDLSIRQLIALAMLGGKVEPDTIRTFVFGGEMQYAPRGSIDALNYWVIDEQARVELIVEMFGVKVPLLPQMVLPGPRQPVEQPSKNGEPALPPPSIEEPMPSDQREDIDEESFDCMTDDFETWSD
ncbi:MAG: LCP family protein [Firmicutes bacterium]|nr:LCP family protein [Bacillota bacterium]